MASTSNTNSAKSTGRTASAARSTARSGSPRRTTSTGRSGTSARRTTGSNGRGTSGRRRTSTSTSTQPKTPVAQAQELAERAVLVPVGASLLARDNLVSTVSDLAARYRTRASVERELRRYERRGASARTRLERRVRRSRTRVERDLRQRRTRVERSVRQNRRRLEREVRSARRDLERQSGELGHRVEQFVSSAQARLSATF